MWNQMIVKLLVRHQESTQTARCRPICLASMTSIRRAVENTSCRADVRMGVVSSTQPTAITPETSEKAFRRSRHHPGQEKRGQMVKMTACCSASLLSVSVTSLSNKPVERLWYFSSIVFKPIFPQKMAEIIIIRTTRIEQHRIKIYFQA